MKLILYTSALKNALSFVAQAKGKRNSSPVLNCVLLTANNNGLTAEMTDLERWARETIPAEVEANGGLCVPLDTLASLVATWDVEKVQLGVTGNTLVLSGGGNRATIKGIEQNEYPAELQIVDVQAFDIDQPGFAAALKNAAMCAVADEARPALFAVNVAQRNITGTDGFRVLTTALDTFLPDVTIPRNAVELVLPFGDKFTAHVSQNRMSVMGDTRRVSFSLAEGVYPNFGKVMPTAHKIKAEVVGDELLAALKSALVFCRDAANVVRMTISNGVLTIRAENAERGDAVAKLNAETDGELEFAVNAQFVFQWLQANRPRLVKVCANDANTPIEFGGVKDQRYVVMPMSLAR